MKRRPDSTGDRRAIVAAFLANLGIAIAKLLGFLATGAASLAAEAVHSLADAGNQALLLLGSKRARHGPTAEHPFGFGAERYFWSFVVAMVLFTAGGLFALIEAEEKLRRPHELSSPGWAIAILVVAFALESLSLRTAMAQARAEKGAGTWRDFIRDSKRAEVPVVLLEDSGALVGLVCALAGVVLATVTGNPRFDALGSLAIGVLLVAIAVTLATEMKSLLIGESADGETVRAVRSAIESDPEVEALLDLRTLQLSPDEALVTARIRTSDPSSGLAAVARLRTAVADIDPAAVTFIEPHVDPRPGGDDAT